MPDDWAEKIWITPQFLMTFLATHSPAIGHKKFWGGNARSEATSIIFDNSLKHFRGGA